MHFTDDAKKSARKIPGSGQYEPKFDLIKEKPRYTTMGTKPTKFQFKKNSKREQPPLRAPRG